MPDFGAPVAAGVNVNPGQGIQTLSDLMSLQKTKQAIQSGALTIQQQQQNLQTGQYTQQGAQAEAQQQQQTAAQRKAIAGIDWNKYNDAGGVVSTDNMLADKTLQQQAGDQFPALLQQAATIRNGQLQNKTALAGLNNTLVSQLGSRMGALRTDPDVIAGNMAGRQKLNDALDQFEAVGGDDAKRVGEVYRTVVNKASTNHLVNSVNTIQLQAMDAASQAGKQAPSYQDTGAVMPQVNPQAAGGNLTGGVSTTAPLQKGLSPQVIMDVYGQPHFVGGGGAGGAAGVSSGAGSSFPTRAQAEAQGAAAGDMSTHFAGLNSSAQSAPLVTALTKTIEGLAPTAFTGPGGDKRQYMAGLANVFHVNLTGDAQTDTNLMNKAMAQLNLSTPAATDAARLLVEAGRPNSQMDPAAIKEAAGTVASQVQMNAAERNFLQTARYSNRGGGDIETYQQGRQAFESSADPRIWQYQELAKSNPRAASAFINRQPDKADLVKKTAALEGMGFFR